MKKILLLSMLLVVGQVTAMLNFFNQPPPPSNFDDLMSDITNLRYRMRDLSQRYNLRLGARPRNNWERIRRYRELENMAADLYEIIDKRLGEIAPRPNDWNILRSTWNELNQKLMQAEANRSRYLRDLEQAENELSEAEAKLHPHWNSEQVEYLRKKVQKLESQHSQFLVPNDLKYFVNLGGFEYMNYKNMIVPFLDERSHLGRQVGDIIQERRRKREIALEWGVDF